MFRDITTLLGDARGLPACGGRAGAAVRRHEDRQGGRHRGARLHPRRRGGPPALAPASCRCARRASCPTRPARWSTRWNTAPTPWRCTSTRSTAGERVMLVDDLIATGGTALAAVQLLREAGAEIVAAAFVIDLPELGGAGEAAGRGRAGLDAGGVRRTLETAPEPDGDRRHRASNLGSGRAKRTPGPFPCRIASPHWAHGREQIVAGLPPHAGFGLRGRRIDLRGGGGARLGGAARGGGVQAAADAAVARDLFPGDADDPAAGAAGARRCCAPTSGSPSGPASGRA